MLENLADIHPALPSFLQLIMLLAGAALSYWVGRRVLVRLVKRLAEATANTWDDALVDNNVVSRLTQLLPVVVIYTGVDLLPGFEAKIENLLLQVTTVYMIMVLAFVMTGVIGAANDIYEAHPRLRSRPLKGFVQLAQVMQIVIGLLLSASVLMDRSPWILLSGFGAMTAVLLLVFKDTILSLVASVQLAVHDLVRVGDWIEVSAYGADGDVVRVDLHSVQVQNWDKTVTSIPTHALVGGSFKNWRSMYESGGRRIKRCLSLDANSVRFLSDEEVVRFKRFALLKDYVATKQAELRAYNEGVAKAQSNVEDTSQKIVFTNPGENPKRPGSQAHARYELYMSATTVEEYLKLGGTQADLEYDRGKGFIEFIESVPIKSEGVVNLRRLTNIGTFRAYIHNYLKHHPRIHQSGMTLLVRQLPNGAEGVPIEIYCFANTTDWVEYEGVQGDIFDHLLAIVGEFGLRLYQQPSGADFASGLSTVAD